MRKSVLSVGMALMLLSSGCKGDKKNVRDRQLPNVIVVLADDLGYGDVGFTGSKTKAPPNIDSLARGGVTITTAYASSSTSPPRR